MSEEAPSSSDTVSSAAEILKNFDSEAALTFFVGWLSGKSYQLRRINLHVTVEKEFRKVARELIYGPDDEKARMGRTTHVKGLLERTSESWAADAQIFPETYLECAIDEVGEAPRLTSRPADERLLEVLKAAEELEVVQPKELEKKRLSIYGFAIGVPGDRTVFIRRANPRRGLGAGKFFGRYSDVLTRVTEPVFAFDEIIDLVVAGNRLITLSQNAFTMIFRDNDELRALIPKWGATLTKHFPVEQESLDRIIERAERDSRHRQRLEAIVSRGHLQDLEKDKLQEAMEVCGLGPVTKFR